MQDICFFDLETTGTDPETCEIVQFAAIRIGKDPIEFKCKPSQPIPDEAAAIHGITNEIVADAKPFSAYVEDLAEFIGDSLLCAYNGLHFDFPILKRHMGDALKSDRCVDPLVYIRKVDRYVKGKGRHKLVQTCTRYGVDVRDAHDALEDVRMLVDLTIKLAYKRGRDLFVSPDGFDDAWFEKQQKLSEQQQRDFEAYRARTKQYTPPKAEPTQPEVIKSCGHDPVMFGCKSCIKRIEREEKAAKATVVEQRKEAAKDKKKGTRSRDW